MVDGSLQKRTALVTGAGSGMGQAHAELLAGRGAHVIVQDIVPERTETVAGAIRAAGGSAEPLPGDAADIRAMQAAVEGIAGARGAVDILVNNAGISGRQLPFEMVSGSHLTLSAADAELGREVLPDPERGVGALFDSILASVTSSP